MNVNINDIKNGMTLILDGKLVMVVEFQHVKPGKGPAFVRIKRRNFEKMRRKCLILAYFYDKICVA